MLQFTLMTDADRKEAAKIEHRRAIEEERKKRIFNPRQRIMGMDLEALSNQIQEKKKLEAEQKQIDQIFDDQLKKSDLVAVAMAQKEVEERKKLAQEIADFRLNFQRFEDRREFDLNDPNAMKKLLPARLHDNDPRIGLSSVQKFEGEDSLGDERKKLQSEQLKSWLKQQMEEREAAEKEQKAAEEAYRAAVIARDYRAVELDQMEKECRKRLDLATARFNQALADERHNMEKEKNRKENEDRMAQMYNVMTSDMMTENPDVSLSNMGPDRRIGYLYKGMSPAEREAFRIAQMAQIEEQKKQKAEEKRFEEEWIAYSNGIQRSIAIMDKELAAKQRKDQQRLMEENKKMAEAQKSHQEYLNKVVYSNKPTAAFYDQFNRSAR